MKRRLILRQPSHLTQFDLTPLDGIFLAISCLLLLIYFPSERRRGLTLLEETPYYCPACFSVPSVASLAVGLAADGRTSFAAFNTELQTATLKSVSRQYGVGFSSAEANQLEELPFLAVKMEQLPSLLTSSDSGVTALNLAGNYPVLTDEQLVSCVVTAKKLAPVCTRQTAYIFLLIDARTNASKVMRLLHLLQNQGINHFYLLAHCQ